MTRSAAEPAKRRWLPRLRFSLRLLLLAVTAFAIGFPIWYRWPYRTEEFHYHQTNGKPDPSRLASRQLITWQRQWGGGKLQQGPMTTWRTALNVRAVERYQHGVKTGPYEFHSDDYDLAGQFLDGEKQGVWRFTHAGRLWRVETYEHGVLHGEFFEASDNGRSYEFRVDHGRLDWTDARSQAHPLFRKLTAGAVDNPRLANALRTTYPDWAIAIRAYDGTLENPLLGLANSVEVPLVIDSRIVLPTKPQTASVNGLDASAYLLQTVQLHGAALDYRYGCIWITTPDDAQDWHDPTGVSEFKPPPGSILAEQWNQIPEFGLYVKDSLLCTVLQYLAQQQQFESELDASRISGIPVTRAVFVSASIDGQSLRNTLGILLYKTKCRCKLEGGKLVILPPEIATAN